MDERRLEDAFNSMLRTDYIALKDTEKLSLLAQYYIDYFGYVGQILSENDQLIVGRRGTGKTTLLYRALVECMRSWDKGLNSKAKPRTLGIYLDLEKCQSLGMGGEYQDFEHAFVSELCDALSEEIMRSWPEVKNEPGFFTRLFKSAEARKSKSVQTLLARLADILRSGIPRIVDYSGMVETRETLRTTEGTKGKLAASVSPNRGPSLTAELSGDDSTSTEYEAMQGQRITYRLMISDLLRIVGELREEAGIPCVLIFIDEFSSLSEELQGRFTTLLKKILGNHAGVFVKICAITDNYRLGSSIILQRDLFELSLDLDAFVERSGSLSGAMKDLELLTKRIIEERLAVYTDISPSEIFEEPELAWPELTKSAMGVPRTLGIVLKHAWHRPAGTAKSKIRPRDIRHGILYASKAYLNQLSGASRDGIAIPEYVEEIFDAIVNRAIQERGKNRSTPASHFMALAKHEAKLKYLNMFFVVHLLTQGRTTKKERLSRSLYCIDYGICLENNLGFGDDKNVVRQQRFAYDDVLAEFDRYFQGRHEAEYICQKCGTTYGESELQIVGQRLNFCPKDRADLTLVRQPPVEGKYTEEEVKIIGAIRSADEEDKVVARQVADDVGCHVQKVAKFGEKLDKEHIIARQKLDDLGKDIYFRPEENLE